MKSDYNFPLPGKQYRLYTTFWSILSFVGLTMAVITSLLVARQPEMAWRGILAAVLMMIQVFLFLWGVTRWHPFSFRISLEIYFILSIGLWVIEVFLVPEVWWLAFTYLGQIFGMLQMRKAVIGAVVIFIILSLVLGGIDFSGFSPGELATWIASWFSIMVFLVYINHLTQASQERGRLIAELQAAQKALEASRQQEAELAVLRERERLARDLHDSLGHTLVALSVQLEAIQRLYRIDPQAASDQVDEMKALTRSSMESLRRSLAGLRTPGLGERALREALQELCVEFGQRSGLQVSCQVAEAAAELRPAVAETLWRVTQEALTNVEKHSQAGWVGVSLDCQDESAHLRVVDDGIGPPEPLPDTSMRFGVRGMRERVEGLGGRLALYRDGDHTVVEVHLPLIRVGDGNGEAN